MCDDCLSSSSTVRPRQTVNANCRKLENGGSLQRQKDLCPKCRKTKITNKIHVDLVTIPRKAKIVKSKPTSAREVETATFSQGEFSSNMMETLKLFSECISTGEIEIYNEFSLQHELGFFLRNTMKGKVVQFERNVSFFGFDKKNFEKREMDIVVYEKSESLLDAVIELKFPKNGQYPEQMFAFCKDVVFAEQLKRAGFNKAYVVIFAEDWLFYKGSQEGIYGFFREGRKLSGVVKKPTGKRDTKLEIKGNYQIKWNDVTGTLKYTVIEAQ